MLPWNLKLKVDIIPKGTLSVWFFQQISLTIFENVLQSTSSRKAAKPLNSFLVTLYGPWVLFGKGRVSQHIILPLKIAFFFQTWTTSWAPFSLCFTIVYLLPALGSLKTLQWWDNQKWLSAQRHIILPASANKKVIILKMAYLYLYCACRWRGVYISKQFSGTYSCLLPTFSLHNLSWRLWSLFAVMRWLGNSWAGGSWSPIKMKIGAFLNTQVKSITYW